jgi:hypothetical protein
MPKLSIASVRLATLPLSDGLTVMPPMIGR